MNNNNRENREEDLDMIVTGNTISHLISYVPVVGDLLTIREKSLNEREINRLDATLSKVQEDLEGIQTEMHVLDGRQEETFIRLYEQFANQVKKELYENKLEAHKNYLVNIIKDLNEGNEILDEEVVFLDILGRMSHVDLNVLSQIEASSTVNSQQIHVDGLSRHIISGAIGNLKSFGLLVQESLSFVSGGEQISEVRLSSFGKKFVDYCVEN